MQRLAQFKAVLVTLLSLSAMAPISQAADEICPIAILAFQERGAGVAGQGEKVADLLFANLAGSPELYLVDREDLSKLLEEQQLGISGAVRPGEASEVGHLTGAKLLITGSVIESDTHLYLVGKIIGTETSRVVGATVKGKVDNELSELVEQLAKQVVETIDDRQSELLPAKREDQDLIADLQSELSDAKRPSVRIEAEEEHIGQSTIDPATETEMAMICQETGFDVIDPKTRQRSEVVIRLSGFSEFAGRLGEMVVVKARVEVQVVDNRTDRLLVADRQTVVVVDLAENIAGRTALQQATLELASRALPKLVVRP